MVEDEHGLQYSLKDLRSHIVFVDQNSSLFSGTVKENLFSDDTDKARKLFDKFGFTKTLDTVIGKDGEGLSPGERKKLIIIRAFLHNGEFLLMDEPLNHLDKKGFEALIDELGAFEGGKIIITHKDMNLDYDSTISL